MTRGTLIRYAAAACLCVATLFAQYPGAPGMPGTPGTPAAPGTYTPPKNGYSSSKGIAIGAAAAAVGAGIGYMVWRHHRNSTIAGCVEKPDNGLTTLIDDKDQSTYALVDQGPVRLTPGERVELKGRKIKEGSDKLAFEVQEIAQDYGPCK